jgi:hypothetical protein
MEFPVGSLALGRAVVDFFACTAVLDAWLLAKTHQRHFLDLKTRAQKRVSIKY